MTMEGQTILIDPSGYYWESNNAKILKTILCRTIHFDIGFSKVIQIEYF